MREATGTTTTFQIILIFTFIFAGFLAVAINYNRVFRIKNETLKIVEKYEGVTNKSLQIVNNYAKQNGYRTKSTCTQGEYGIASLDSTDLELVGRNSNKKYYYCITSRCNTANCAKTSTSTIVYGFRFFFKFELPVVGDLTLFKISGETKQIKFYSDAQKLR